MAHGGPYDHLKNTHTFIIHNLYVSEYSTYLHMKKCEGAGGGRCSPPGYVHHLSLGVVSSRECLRISNKCVISYSVLIRK
jgi:hypothetical protein